MHILGTCLEKKLLHQPTLFSNIYVYIYFTSLHKMEKQWKRIKEYQLAHGLL